MNEVTEVLEALAQEQGVDLAMIVSRDGFVYALETERRLPWEPEMIGAAVSTYWAAADAVGGELDAGSGRSAILELKEAHISTAALGGNDLILTVVAERGVNPATMRYLTVKFSQLLRHLL